MASKASPKDSMKSTWRHLDHSQWSFWHWLYEIFGVHPSNLDQAVPVHAKSDKVHHIPHLVQHRWVLVHAALPLAIHQAYISYNGRNLNTTAAYIYYTTFFIAHGTHVIQLARWLGHSYGYLDGDKCRRDEVPDLGVGKVARSLLLTPILRITMTVFLTYRAGETPLATNWPWLPLEIGLYSIVLDFWFYWYHRLMHDVDSLWQYHRTHHLTKHPNPLLALYADSEQEIFDILAIPFLAWASLKLIGLPMGFYDWWFCHQYITYGELLGHSGLRVHSTPPSPLSWLLELLGCELIIEDHDLHHRSGWKKSHNYGKQTRLWDKLFGTCHERIECLDTNVDFRYPVPIPLIFDPSIPSPPPSI